MSFVEAGPLEASVMPALGSLVDLVTLGVAGAVGLRCCAQHYQQVSERFVVV